MSMVETCYRLADAPGLALLADFHARPYQPVIRSLQKHRPGLICIAGDCFYGSRPQDGVSPLVSQPTVLPFLENCAAIAPTYLALGNHERWLDAEDLDGLRGTGVTVLDNGWVEHGGLVIGGLTSGYCMDYRRFRAGKTGRTSGSQKKDRYPAELHHTDYTHRKSGRTSGSRKTDRYPAELHHTDYTHRPDTGWLAAFAAAPGYHILISHHPEYFRLVPEGVELILAGHAHGGQIRLFGRGVFAPGQGFWPKYTKGIYENRLIVSAGLTNTTSVPRLFNPTEIVYVNTD